MPEKTPNHPKQKLAERSLKEKRRDKKAKKTAREAPEVLR